MRSKPKTYKDLLFWRNSFETSLLIIKLSKKIPQNMESRVILNQLFRSSTSIGANIAEGYGRYGPKEFPRFLQIALGSANETDYWLFMLKECFPKYVREIDLVIDKNSETIKMLAASLKTINKKKKSG